MPESPPIQVFIADAFKREARQLKKRYRNIKPAGAIAKHRLCLLALISLIMETAASQVAPTTLRETAIAKLQQLTEPLLQEVSDFIDFIIDKYQPEAEHL